MLHFINMAAFSCRYLLASHGVKFHLAQRSDTATVPIGKDARQTNDFEERVSRLIWVSIAVKQKVLHVRQIILCDAIGNDYGFLPCALAAN